MNFNPEPSKWVQDVMFIRNVQELHYSQFRYSSVKETCNQKHLSMLWDLKLDCQEHFKSLIKKKIKQLFCHVNS